MASPLVDTKLFVPHPRRTVVTRSRLNERLDRGAEAKLTVVSAPAGFGKTTAVVAWLDHAPENRSVAWLSLEDADKEPVSFWTYVVTALHATAPSVGASVLPLLASTQPPLEALLATVLNELGALQNDLYLVLDDYHLVDGPGVAAGMAYLLEHLPPQVHVLLSTRADPDLPLARLRARGELVEVRAVDLRFTPAEVSAYFTAATDLGLSERDIATLESRTEGWVAALQLAALSMQGRVDVAGFIAGFAGDDRYIVDYLVEEVLARQSEHVRSFLLQTSVLDRLTGDLCDTVTGQRGGNSMLEALDRANLFVVPLDDNRRWYRYHHLFADVLQTHLRDERPDHVAALHDRASHWYDHAGEPAAAVRHAIAAGDTARVADLVELAIPALQRARQEAIIRGWIDAIPDAVVRARPVLGIGFVGALMSGGEFDDVPRRLRDIERWLPTSTPDAAGGGAHSAVMVVVDEAQLELLPGMVELYWTGLALVTGDVPGIQLHAQQTLAAATPDDHVTRAGAYALSGLASWSAGDLDAAHRDYSRSVEGLRRGGNFSDVLGCSVTLADIRITQGRLTEALTTYETALQLASRQPGTTRGTADMYIGIAALRLERGDVDAAAEYLRRGQDLGEDFGLPQYPYRRLMTTALVREVQGDSDGALEMLEQAERVYIADFLPNVRPVPALRARLLASHGKVGDALAWASEHGLSADDDLSYIHEYEHIALAEVMLARYTTQPTGSTLQATHGLLERLLVEAQRGARTGNVIEILALQALAHDASGSTGQALPPLQRALTLAEPQGYVRVFTRHGAPMASMLNRLVPGMPDRAYLRRLIAATAEHLASLNVAESARSSTTQRLVDPLSPRELEVLRLLSTELDGPELARHLVVSLNTLRTHTKNIYAKLDVTNRRAAVRRAAELDLLERHLDR